MGVPVNQGFKGKFSCFPERADGSAAGFDTADFAPNAVADSDQVTVFIDPVTLVGFCMRNDPAFGGSVTVTPTIDSALAPGLPSPLSGSVTFDFLPGEATVLRVVGEEVPV